jgi:hypothetical protein
VALVKPLQTGDPRHSTRSHAVLYVQYSEESPTPILPCFCSCCDIYPAPTPGQTTTPATAVVIPAPNLSVCEFWLCCYTVGIFFLHPSSPVPSGSAAVGRSCDTYFFFRSDGCRNSKQKQPCTRSTRYLPQAHYSRCFVERYHGPHSSCCFVNSKPPSQATQ